MNAAAQNPPRNGEGDRAKRGGGGRERLQRPIVYAARKLRKKMTPPEASLWQLLRKRPNGIKFRRQHPIDPYVVDFFPIARLVIEIDGWAHDTASRAQDDEKRDQALSARGFSIMRMPAEEVLSDAVAVTSAILARAESPLHQASPGPPPRAGEDM